MVASARATDGHQVGSSRCVGEIRKGHLRPAAEAQATRVDCSGRTRDVEHKLVIVLLRKTARAIGAPRAVRRNASCRTPTDRIRHQLAVASLPRVSFHSLRHACASYLLSAGVPMRVVQEVLGHSQLSTTADIYAHVAPDLQRDAAARLGALLERRATS